MANLVTILIETRDLNVLAEAETAARRAVALAPRLPRALTMLAQVLLDSAQGRLDEAGELPEATEPGELSRLTGGNRVRPPHEPDGARRPERRRVTRR